MLITILTLFQISNFSQGYQECMARSLSTEYTKSNLRCSAVSSKLVQKQHECLMNAGLCQQLKMRSLQIEHFLHFVGDNSGYPAIMPRKRLSYPISNKMYRVTEYYYQQLQLFKRSVYTAMTSCRKQDGKDGPRYELRTNKDTAGDILRYFVKRD